MLVLVALLGFVAQPVAAGAPAGSIASAACMSACPDAQVDCGKTCHPCGALGRICAANTGCGNALTFERLAPAALDPDSAPSFYSRRALPTLHGRSISPELHPPSTSDRQA
jgi:hypothetical protein